MAQVVFKDDTAVVLFDEREMVVVNEANRRDRDFLQNAIIELLSSLARQHNDIATRKKIAELKSGQPGQFGALGGPGGLILA